MSKYAIEIEGLWKKYRLGETQPYVLLRDVLMNPFGKKGGKKDVDEFWALRDINLKVKEGEVLGVIGRNGSGKSTLLKILSRITPPTKGEIRLRGRVASLLEVGTGFSPELTGRENVFLNGSILGMSREEIKRKFDEIVDFSGVEKFIDTPVKRYSSGMYVRLAFAVAAHLESEILIVDEVLAVGDAEFQKKCLGKMNSVARSGRTVLFVSHNMAAVNQLCDTAALLQDGKKVSSGETGVVVNRYLQKLSINNLRKSWIGSGKKIGNEFFFAKKFYISSQPNNEVEKLTTMPEMTVCIEGDIVKLKNDLLLGYRLYNERDELIYTSTHRDTPGGKWPSLVAGHNRLRSQIPSGLLRPGLYRLEMIAKLHGQAWIIGPGQESISIFIEVSKDPEESPFLGLRREQLVLPIINWQNY